MNFPRRSEDDALELRTRLDLVSRAYRLLQARRLPPVWIDGWSIRVRPELFGPRVRISWDAFAKLVSDAESRDEARQECVA